MKNSLATLACCVALVAALSPAFAPVLAAAVNRPAIDGHGPASSADTEQCSRHDKQRGDIHGADEGRQPATSPAPRH